MVDETDRKIIKKPENIEGFTFYTGTYDIEEIKSEIKEQCGYDRNDDNVEVKLWLYKNTMTIRKDTYNLA